MLRYPRTTQEIRANGKRGVIDHDGYRVVVRGKRRNLPTSYDDLWLSHLSCNYLPWKLQRKKQYKGSSDWKKHLWAYRWKLS